MAIKDKGLWKLLNVVEPRQLADLEAALAAEKVEPLVLRGAEIHDAASLFARAHQDLPHPAGRGVSDGWAALSDNLWECLMLSPQREFALLWLDSDHMLTSNLEEFLEAVDALLRLGRQLYQPTAPRTPGKTFYLFLLSRGAALP